MNVRPLTATTWDSGSEENGIIIKWNTRKSIEHYSKESTTRKPGN
jgi:hypothetical protein